MTTQPKPIQLLTEERARDFLAGADAEDADPFAE